MNHPALIPGSVAVVTGGAAGIKCVHPAQVRTRAEAKAAVFDSIEVFYNRQRLRSTLRYRTPAEAWASMEEVTMRAAA